jgi:hypothetical protein
LALRVAWLDVQLLRQASLALFWTASALEGKTRVQQQASRTRSRRPNVHVGA